MSDNAKPASGCTVEDLVGFKISLVIEFRRKLQRSGLFFTPAEWAHAATIADDRIVLDSLGVPDSSEPNACTHVLRA
jgi:hypothetical protein